jgi:transcriptional pleiotropic regulator of transition state genes
VKSTGIVRQVDNLDRIVIPKELCRALNVAPKAPMEIFFEDGRIVIKQYVDKADAKKKGDLGVVRRLDALNRIVIPKELCKKMDLEPKDALEIFVEGEMLVFGKYEPSCIFCHEANNVINFKGKLVCKDCVNEISKML